MVLLELKVLSQRFDDRSRGGKHQQVFSCARKEPTHRFAFPQNQRPAVIWFDKYMQHFICNFLNSKQPRTDRLIAELFEDFSSDCLFGRFAFFNPAAKQRPMIRECRGVLGPMLKQHLAVSFVQYQY
jgi:hypothetical protein